VKAVCDELLALAVEYVELGGRIDEVFNRPLVFLEANIGVAEGARNAGPAHKVGNGLLELMATLRLRTAKLKQDQLGVLVPVHGSTPTT